MRIDSIENFGTAEACADSLHPVVRRCKFPESYCYLFGEDLFLVLNGRHFFNDKVRVKIGCTSNPCQRINSLWTTSPEWDYHHLWFEPELGRDIETALHKYYKSARIGGEIFELPAWEILWLKNLSAARIIYDIFDECRFPNWDWLCQFHWNEKWKACGTINHPEPDVEFLARTLHPENTHAPARPEHIFVCQPAS